MDVYNAFTWDSENDKVKIDKVLEQFEKFCEPLKNRIYEGQASGESIDKYATVVRNMADNCKFQDMKDSLIRDRIVFGVTDNQVRRRLLRVPELTLLDKALEIARAAEATQNQLKQMQNLHKVNALGKKKESFPGKKFEERKPVSGSVQQIDCKFCGRKHVRDRMKRPAYGHQCKKYGRNNHFAVKCTGVKKQNERSGVHQNLHYVDDFHQSSLEEYTIDVNSPYHCCWKCKVLP